MSEDGALPTTLATGDTHKVGKSYFAIDDFDCHDGTPYPEKWISLRLGPLIRTLDAIRARWGSPIVVVSGYRSPAWNTKVGGAKASQHNEGRAADVKPTRDRDEPFVPRVERLHRLVLGMWDNGDLADLGGLGYYPGRWIHVDVRPRVPIGHLARWNGVGVGSEPG